MRAKQGELSLRELEDKEQGYVIKVVQELYDEEMNKTKEQKKQETDSTVKSILDKYK